VLDPEAPVSIGAMVGPDAFTEVRYLAHWKQLKALKLIPRYAEEFRRHFGRASGGLIHPYRTEDADTVVISLGSVNGTIKDVVDEMREAGARIGSLSICSFRPFPLDALREALRNARRVVVLEKSLAVGFGGMVATNVKMALPAEHGPVYTVIAGLGGRPITKRSLHGLFRAAIGDALDEVHFLDLDRATVDREIARAASVRRSGPTAENILRDRGPLRRAV
jgi:pyruvate ferredoxin oxidoreductase alpha subunit